MLLLILHRAARRVGSVPVAVAPRTMFAGSVHIRGPRHPSLSLLQVSYLLCKCLLMKAWRRHRDPVDQSVAISLCNDNHGKHIIVYCQTQHLFMLLAIIVVHEHVTQCMYICHNYKVHIAFLSLFLSLSLHLSRCTRAVTHVVVGSASRPLTLWVFPAGAGHSGTGALGAPAAPRPATWRSPRPSSAPPGARRHEKRGIAEIRYFFCPQPPERSLRTQVQEANKDLGPAPG